MRKILDYLAYALASILIVAKDFFGLFLMVIAVKGFVVSSSILYVIWLLVGYYVLSFRIELLFKKEA